jgi:hypothetical protein
MNPVSLAFLLVVALPLSLITCESDAPHRSIEGTYTDAQRFKDAHGTLVLRNGVDSKIASGLSMRDGDYRYCDRDRRCENGRYHFERVSDLVSHAYDRLGFDGAAMAGAYDSTGWVEYDFSGEPMIGFGDPDGGPDFNKVR